MNVLQTIKATARGLFSGWGQKWTVVTQRGWLYTPDNYQQPNTTYDWATLAGRPEMNTAVAAAIRWVNDHARNAHLEVRRYVDRGDDEVQPNHALVELIENPNEDYDGDTLWKLTEADFLAAGESYWRKVRNVYGEVIELWHQPRETVQPEWPTDGSVFISHYTVTIDGHPYPVDKKDIVAFRDGIDYETRRGCPRLIAASSSIAAHNEVPIYLYTLLRKLGIPGLVISAKDSESNPFPDGQPAVETFRKDLDRRIQGDNRFRSLILPGPVDVHEIGRSPEDMALDETAAQPEQVIGAMTGINSMATGMPSSAKSKTYANMKEAKGDAWDTLRGIQRALASTVTRQLLRTDFGADRQLYVCWDYTDVGELQEEATAISDRIVSEWDSDLITRDEARTKLGYPAAPQDGALFKTEWMSKVGGTPEQMDPANKQPAEGADQGANSQPPTLMEDDEEDGPERDAA